MIVVLHVSKVLSPAIFISLPINGIEIGAITEVGIVVVLQRNLKLAREPETGGAAIVTSYRFALAPPSISAFLKSFILNAIF